MLPTSIGRRGEGTALSTAFVQLNVRVWRAYPCVSDKEQESRRVLSIMDRIFMASASVQAVTARLGQLHRYLFLVPVLAVALVFVGINALRDGAQLGNHIVTFYTAPDDAASTTSRWAAPEVERDDQLGSRRTLELLAPGSTLKVIAADLSGRMELTASAAVFFVAFATLVCLCGVWIYQCRCTPFARRGWILCSLAGALIVSTIGWLIWFHDTRRVSLLLASFDELATTLLQHTEVDLAWLDHSTGALSLLSAVLIAVTAAVILDGVSSAPARLLDLRRRCAALRATLAAGAAVLASAAIVVRTLQNWLLGFVANAEALRPIADSWTTALGTYWTLVLTAAYLPAAAVVHRAAIKMADARERAPDDDRTRDQWMEEQGLNVSVRGQMMRVLLLLAPWLSGGPLADIAAQLSA